MVTMVLTFWIKLRHAEECPSRRGQSANYPRLKRPKSLNQVLIFGTEGPVKCSNTVGMGESPAEGALILARHTIRCEGEPECPVRVPSASNGTCKAHTSELLKLREKESESSPTTNCRASISFYLDHIRCDLLCHASFLEVSCPQLGTTKDLNILN